MENITICKPLEKEQHVYTSNGRSIEINILTEMESSEFLLKYEGA